jgi:hypothetical protein
MQTYAGKGNYWILVVKDWGADIFDECANELRIYARFQQDSSTIWEEPSIPARIVMYPDVLILLPSFTDFRSAINKTGWAKSVCFPSAHCHSFPSTYSGMSKVQREIPGSVLTAGESLPFRPHNIRIRLLTVMPHRFLFDDDLIPHVIPSSSSSSSCTANATWHLFSLIVLPGWRDVEFQLPPTFSTFFQPLQFFPTNTVYFRHAHNVTAFQCTAFWLIKLMARSRDFLVLAYGMRMTSLEPETFQQMDANTYPWLCPKSPSFLSRALEQ